MHVQPAVGDGLSNVTFQLVPLADPVRFPQVNDLMTRTAVAFGVIHRHIRIAHQLIGHVLTTAAESDSNARGNADPMPLDMEREGERLINPVGQQLHIGFVVQVLAQDDEFITRHPRQRVPWTQQPRQPAGNRHQQTVPNLVPIAVIDVLEPVKIGKQQGGRRVRAVPALCGMLQTLRQ
jgi:hypothetical protein